MAAAVLRTLKNITNTPNPVSARTIHMTPSLCKKVSGKYRRTKNASRPLTYEQSNPPHQIGSSKSWNSWNTTTLEGGLMRGEILIDDIVIRKFLIGTFHGMIFSEIIIKRQHNIIRIAFICNPKIVRRKISFLMGYSEEMLQYMFQCPVKLEINFISDPRSVVFKYW